MTIAVLASDLIKEELSAKGFPDEVEVIWADSMSSLTIIEADAYFDLLFEFDRERIGKLKRLLPVPVFVNAIVRTCAEIGNGFIRINAWPTMAGRSVAELVISDGDAEKVATIFETLNWKYVRSPDVPGMITPRVVSMIINEAFYALGENVSTPSEIDVAMKLGTNYPYGPFEWGEKIGYENIRELLTVLAKTESRYEVAPMLNNE